MWLGAATLWLSALALSVELPQLAADKADDALLAASSGSAARVHAAQAAGLEVGAMDPLTDAGLLVEASAALHRREPQQARAYLQQAVAREPSDAEAWRLLSLVDHGLMDGSGARLAGQRTLQLNPLGRYGAAVVATQLRTAPPNTSATRYPTPAPGR